MEKYVTSPNFKTIGLLLALIFSALLAIVFFGKVEDVLIWISPEQRLQWIAPITCPDGIIEIPPSSTSEKRDILVTCNVPMPDGRKLDITIQSLGYLTLFQYLACFAPMFVIFGLIVILMPSIFKGSKK